jgi:cbb3-type cytochrome oxidase subunit 3
LAAIGNERFGRKRALHINDATLNLMIDIIFVAVLTLFFVAGELYALWCEKL